MLFSWKYENNMQSRCDETLNIFRFCFFFLSFLRFVCVWALVRSLALNRFTSIFAYIFRLYAFIHFRYFSCCYLIFVLISTLCHDSFQGFGAFSESATMHTIFVCLLDMSANKTMMHTHTVINTQIHTHPAGDFHFFGFFLSKMMTSWNDINAHIFV